MGFHLNSLFDQIITVGGKPVSFIFVHDYVSKAFHQCLKKEVRKMNRRDEFDSMTDYELVHNVCRKERLTLYNLYKMHFVNEKLESTAP
mmetsp:Transcript_8606/g.14543  ORF Transcript_8606/g.14543 Transcript_8606/m.14543 type:complete len:89 (-) Transcript_8606:273-539(-)